MKQRDQTFFLWQNLLRATMLLTRGHDRTSKQLKGMPMSQTFKLDSKGYARGVSKVLTLKPLSKALSSVSSRGGVHTDFKRSESAVGERNVKKR